jgi:hypothetical protein
MSECADLMDSPPGRQQETDKTMPSYCSYDQYTSEDWQTYEEDGELYSCDDSHCSECGNECYGCNECRDEYEDEFQYSRTSLQDVFPRCIDSYSSKPSPVFWSTGGFSAGRLSGRFGKRMMFFGIEIEAEANHDRINGDTTYAAMDSTISAYSPLTDRLYYKHDGSLHDGVEIVSHPMTMDSWNELHAMGELNFYRDMYRNGLHCTHRTGMHVHVNKSSFSSMGHMARFTHLVIDNPAYFKAVAQRNEEGYASFGRFKISEVIRSNGSVYGPRGAINLSNPHTVEVRMFASSLRPRVVLGNIQLCAALQTYTRERQSPGKTKGISDHLTFASFLEYVRKEERNYPFALPMLESAASCISPEENRRLALSLRPSPRFYR